MARENENERNKRDKSKGTPMSLEGRKFHFARDDEGRIYAENEIETEVANREGWLLPPRKGEQRKEIFFSGLERIEATLEATGELKDSMPVYVFVRAEYTSPKMVERLILTVNVGGSCVSENIEHLP